MISTWFGRRQVDDGLWTFARKIGPPVVRRGQQHYNDEYVWERRMRVSVIATVLNEAKAIQRLLDSLVAQTRAPDEIVIVDGGSCDDTPAILHRFASQSTVPIRVLSYPGSNISQGRNRAITAASGTVIAATDSGVRLDDDWLERLVAPFETANPPDVVGGFFVADPHSVFERALGAVTLPLVHEVVNSRFYPSSRSVAFRRSAWEVLGGYPEWLDYCEDLFLDFAFEDAGYRVVFEPRAVARFRPRPSLQAFFRQYYRYARGDGKADFWRVRHAIRYAIYVVAAPAIVALSIWRGLGWLVLLALGLVAMLRKPIMRLAHGPRLTWGDRLAVYAWLPVIRVAGDVAKMLGYPVGVWWRRRHGPIGPWPKRHF